MLAISRSEIKNFDLAYVSKTRKKIEQEQLSKVMNLSYCLGRNGGVVTLSCMGLFLICVSALLLMLTDETRVSVPYTELDKEIKFFVDQDLKGPIAVAIVLENFYTNLRSYIDSLSEHFVSKCSDVQTYAQVFEVRPRDSFPELGIGDDNDLFSPCGLQSAAFFNDEISITDINNRKIPIETETSQPRYSLLRFYKNLGEQVWINSLTSARLQNWYTYQFTSTNMLLLGFLDVFYFRSGYYVLHIDQNTWPAKLFNVNKSVVFIRVGAFGSSQKILAIITALTGFFLLVVALLFRLAISRNIVYPCFSLQEFDNLKKLWLNQKRLNNNS